MIFRDFKLGESMELDDLSAELDSMLDVMLGRIDSPVDEGIATMMVVAEAYFARCCEITAIIQRWEADGEVNKGDAFYKFRVGELRTVTELMKKSADVGSRRITVELSKIQV